MLRMRGTKLFDWFWFDVCAAPWKSNSPYMLRSVVAVALPWARNDTRLWRAEKRDSGVKL